MIPELGITQHIETGQRGITAVMMRLSPRVEQYSIDEMFLNIRGIDGCTDFESFGQQLREHVKGGTGLTIGVGMGPTQTQAKSAQWASKE